MHIKGIIPAMVTAFSENGTINEKATTQLVEKLIRGGVHGLFILGTNGEFYQLSAEEKIMFAKLVVDTVKQRIPVYAGAGQCGTKETIRLAKAFKEAGVDCISVITPYFQKLNQEELFSHYETIAREVDMPIILYHIPSLTQNSLEPVTVKRLSVIPQIVGIKDSSGNLENTKAYVQETKGNNFVVLEGSDSLILSGLELGCKGAVASTANLLTQLVVSIYENFQSGKYEEANEAQQKIETLRTVLKRAAQPSVLKRALTLSGLDVGYARRPIARPSKQTDQEIIKVLEFYGIDPLRPD